MFQYDEILPESKETEIAQKIRNFYLPNGQIVDETSFGEITKVKIIRVQNVLSQFK